MAAPQPTPERVAELLGAEDARTRRLAMRLTLLPVAVGLGVVVAAVWGVSKAHRQRDALRDEAKALDAQKKELAAAVESLQAQKAQLLEDIDQRKRVFAEFQGKLPAKAREQATAIETGLEQTRRGEYAQALSSYQRVTSENPGSVALGLEGSVQLKAGNVAAAVDTLRRAVQRDPRNAGARYDLAVALAAAGQEEEAVRESDEAFRADASLETRAASDQAFWPIRRLREARRGDRSAATEQEKAHVKAGLAAAHAGELEKAISEYGKALEVNPRNADVLNWRGYAQYRQGRFDDAAETLRRAVSLAGGHPEAHYNLGLTLWKQGRQAEAGEELKRAFALDPHLRDAARGDHRSEPIVKFIEQRR